MSKKLIVKLESLLGVSYTNAKIAVEELKKEYNITEKELSPVLTPAQVEEIYNDDDSRDSAPLEAGQTTNDSF